MFFHVLQKQSAFIRDVRSSFQNTRRAAFEWFWRKRLLLLAAFAVILAMAAAHNYAASFNSSSVVLSFNYEQAAMGLNPNETRFNISELKQSEVMTKALDYAGLTGILTPAQLADCISISPTNATGKAAEYIATSYAIRFTNKYGIEKRLASDMLSLILKAYKDFFVANYAQNQSILKFSFDTEESEYLMVLDLLKIRADQLKKYIDTRLGETRNYSDPATGISFTALSETIANFIEYDVTGLEAYILENGIAQDKDALLSMLEYKQMLNQLSYDKKMAEYAVTIEGIDMFDEAMITIVMIPTRDTGYEYYMSRTKTLMDTLADSAADALRIATVTDAVLRNDTYLTGQFENAAPAGELYDKADQMIGSMWEKLDRLAQTINELDTSYLHYSTKDYMTVEGDGMTFRSRLQIVDAGITALLVMLVIFFLKFLQLWRREWVRRNLYR